MEDVVLSVSDALALFNQTLDYAYPTIVIEGEVSGYTVNQGKFVFFDVKDDESSLNCFMMLFHVRTPIEDGMKVVVTAAPRITKRGRFSLTIRSVRPVGEGALRKSFELLKAKLDKEGLFAPERKRALPNMPKKVAVVSSTQAAGYADFIKIVNNRWGGLQVQSAHVQVQGDAAPDQIIRAIEYFNSRSDPAEVLVLVRGGGSADDLAAFNDEKLVRALAASRIPTLVGVGHEVDTSLSDMVADVRAATPSNAAEILVPDKRELIRLAQGQVYGMSQRFTRAIREAKQQMRQQLEGVLERIDQQYQEQHSALQARQRLLRQIDPETVLQRGYSIVRGEAVKGSLVEIETFEKLIQAEVVDVREK